MTTKTILGSALNNCGIGGNVLPMNSPARQSTVKLVLKNNFTPQG